MTLTKELKSQGYDLINGPVRNHKPMQLWLKEPSEEVQFQYAHISHAFVSKVDLVEIENPALSVNASTKDEYAFNIGISVLDGLLKAIGLGTLDLSAKLKSGKTVTISYNNAISKECTRGNMEDYLATADFVHANPILLKHANRNRILVITGVITAKNLIVDIETDFSVNAELVADLNKLASGKLDFSISADNKLKMLSNGDYYSPVAVQAHRMDFDKNVFNGLTLVTDDGNTF